MAASGENCPLLPSLQGEVKGGKSADVKDVGKTREVGKGRQCRYRGGGYLWCANERLALDVKTLHRDAKILYVQMSGRPVSLRANQRHRVAGQPRTGNRMFETVHPGYP